MKSSTLLLLAAGGAVLILKAKPDWWSSFNFKNAPPITGGDFLGDNPIVATTPPYANTASMYVQGGISNGVPPSNTDFTNDGTLGTYSPPSYQVWRASDVIA